MKTWNTINTVNIHFLPVVTDQEGNQILLISPS